MSDTDSDAVTANGTPSSGKADRGGAAASGGRLSMRKPAASRSSSSAGTAGSSRTARTSTGGPSTLPVPKSINLVCAAMGVMVLGNIISALVLLGSTDMLKRYVISSNEKAKAPQDPFDAVHGVYALRQGAFFQALLFLVMLGLLGYALRRTRSASASRWAVLVIFIVTSLPYQVVPASGLPAPVQVINVIVGALSIAIVLLIFVPRQSQRYFRECREANAPAEMRGQPRPGLGSLFGPKRPRPAPAGAARTTTGAARTRPADTRPASSKAKAKVRSDTEAISRGADLARSRAKASKSRRTD